MNVYETLTAKLIEKIETENRLPWQKPWTRTAEGGASINGVSMKPYRGFFNTVMTMGWETPVFFTFKQASELGGQIIKGSKSTPIIYWNFIEKKNDDDEVISKFPMLKYFNVFNIDQIDWADKRDEMYSKYDIKIIKREEGEAEKVFTDYISRENIKLIGAAEAYYSPASDLIALPPFQSFKSENAYLGTAFHEAAHSTKKESRLNRPSDNYAFEELVAELASSFITCRLNVFDEKEEMNSAAYLKAWQSRISKNPKEIINAMGKAQKACEYIMGRVEDQEYSE